MSKNSPKQNIEAFLNWAGNSRIKKDNTPVRKKRPQIDYTPFEDEEI